MRRLIDKIKIKSVKVKPPFAEIDIAQRKDSNMEVAAFRLGWWLSTLNSIQIISRNVDTENKSKLEHIESEIMYLGEYLGIDTIKNDIVIMKRKVENDKLTETVDFAQTISLKLEISHSREVSKLFLLGWDMVNCYALIVGQYREPQLICDLIGVVSKSLEYISLPRNVKRSITSYHSKCKTSGLNEEDFRTLTLAFPKWKDDIINYLTL